MTAPSFHGVCRRLGRLIGLTRNCRKYDYRAHWTTFTERMSRLDSADELTREVARAVAKAADATCAAVYLADPGGVTYHLRAGVGDARFAPCLDQTADVPSWLRTALARSLAAPCRRFLTTPALPAALGVAIRWRAELLGFIVLGPLRAGTDYTDEDSQFLATVAAHAAAALTASRVSSPAAEPHRLQTFDRFTGTVIHDLKNAVSALSLLARNAPGNLADPEFRHDAMTTLSRTVDRMRRLLTKLSSADATTPPARTEPIDLRSSSSRPRRRWPPVPRYSSCGTWVR